MTINQEIQNIAEAIRQSVAAERIYLFGSHARGITDENSDYDFYVVLPDDGLRPLEAVQKARRSLSALNRVTPVDILADYRGRFNDRARFNTLERRIANEGVVLYERA